MLNLFMLSVIYNPYVLSAIMLNVFMPNVVAPEQGTLTKVK
jgi:hypothetical protein